MRSSRLVSGLATAVLLFACSGLSPDPGAAQSAEPAAVPPPEPVLPVPTERQLEWQRDE